MEEFVEFIIENWIVILITIVFLIILFGVIYANTSLEQYFNVFNKYNNQQVDFDGDALTFAYVINRLFFNNQVNIDICENKKSNASYNPNTKTICLSPDIAYQNSISTFAVVAHEFGHTIQHIKTPQILIDNSKLSHTVKILGLFSYFFIGLCILAFIYVSFTVSLLCFLVFILNFIIALSLKISTIKIEKNASVNAIEILSQTPFFSKNELKDCAKVLEYAKKTYIGDFISALLCWTGLVRKTKIF